MALKSNMRIRRKKGVREEPSGPLAQEPSSRPECRNFLAPSWCCLHLKKGDQVPKKTRPLHSSSLSSKASQTNPPHPSSCSHRCYHRGLQEIPPPCTLARTVARPTKRRHHDTTLASTRATDPSRDDRGSSLLSGTRAQGDDSAASSFASKPL